MVEDIVKSPEGHKVDHHGQHAAKSPEESPGPHNQLGSHWEESFVDFDCLQVEVDTSLHAQYNGKGQNGFWVHWNPKHGVLFEHGLQAPCCCSCCCGHE